MGVRGLQTFIENHCPPDCFAVVDVKQLVEDFRAKTGVQTPKIVFDGQSTMRFIYGDLDWVSGGQLKQFMENITNFVNAFKELGVHPVFFFGGYADISSKKVWYIRCQEKLKTAYRLFDSLADGTQTKDLESYLYIMPTNIGFSHYFEQVEGCEVHKSLNESNAEIAHYARENNCLAVFAQDSDFLIYKSAKYYLSSKHLNIATMETRHYDRRQLINVLGIHSSQLPLFASLAGNNTINFKDLRYFHSWLCNWQNPRFEILYPAIAKYIQKLPSGSALFDALPDIAKQALNNSEASTILAASIRHYRSTPETLLPAGVSEYPEWNAIVEKAEELHRTNKNSSIIFKIMLGEGFGSSTGFEDFRQKDLPAAMCLLRPMRRRFYGIILKEKPVNLEPKSVEELCMEGPRSLEKSFQVSPILPSDHHPGLIALWSDDRSEEMQNIRWQLFAHSVSPNLSHEDLKNLPDHLILPVSSLFYLAEKNCMEQWEIEALLAVAMTLPTESLEQLADLPSDPVNVRAVRITTIFLRTLTTVIRLLSVCGYPLLSSEAFAHPYFDGKLFQEKYRNAKYGVSQDVLFEDQTLVPQFQKAKQILFKNPDHKRRPYAFD